MLTKRLREKGRYNMEGITYPMDNSSFVTFFNQHTEDAQKANKAYKAIYGIKDFNATIKPYINKGVMSIFDTEPSQKTMTYVLLICKAVENRLIIESEV